MGKKKTPKFSVFEKWAAWYSSIILHFDAPWTTPCTKESDQPKESDGAYFPFCIYDNGNKEEQYEMMSEQTYDQGEYGVHSTDVTIMFFDKCRKTMMQLIMYAIGPEYSSCSDDSESDDGTLHSSSDRDDAAKFPFPVFGSEWFGEWCEDAYGTDVPIAACHDGKKPVLAIRNLADTDACVNAIRAFTRHHRAKTVNIGRSSDVAESRAFIERVYDLTELAYCEQ